jgi:hypothetical protein
VPLPAGFAAARRLASELAAAYAAKPMVEIDGCVRTALSGPPPAQIATIVGSPRQWVTMTLEVTRRRRPSSTRYDLLTAQVNLE